MFIYTNFRLIRKKKLSKKLLIQLIFIYNKLLYNNYIIKLIKV